VAGGLDLTGLDMSSAAIAQLAPRAPDRCDRQVALSARCAALNSYGREPTTQGQDGSIPLCNVFQQAFPGAGIMLLGVEEPKCLIHAPDESVDPTEIEHMAPAEAQLLASYGYAGASSGQRPRRGVALRSRP
jgi:hypothetical protein